MAFLARNRLPVLAGLGEKRRAGIRAAKSNPSPISSPASPIFRMNGCATSNPKSGPQKVSRPPVQHFETGGTTGMPKQRIGWDDYKTDYEEFSAKISDQHSCAAAPGSWSAPPAHAGCGWPSSTWPLSRQRLLLRGPGPALGEKNHGRTKNRPGARLQDHVVEQATTILKHRKSPACSPRPNCWKPWAKK